MSGHDVRVKRCQLTLHGRGGWGWGTDPRRHLEAALPEVERALQRIVAEADLPEDAEVHLTEPVRLRWRPDRTLDDEVRQEAVAALRAAVVHRPTPDAVLDPTTAPASGTGDDATTAPARRTEPPQAAGPAAVVGRWSRTGRLARLVATWSEETVRRWCGLLTSATGDGVELGDDAVEAVAAAVLAQASRPGEPALGAAHRLLVVLGALAAAAGDRPLARRTAAVAAGMVGAEPGQATREAEPEAKSTRRETAVRPHDEPPAGSTLASEHRGRTTATPGPVPVPGLPFLVIVQLGRLGYLDAVAAAASATPDPDTTTRVLLGALAGKVLGPPARGWSRTPAEIAAVALAAGWSGPDQDAASRTVAGRADALLAPLTTALTQLYVEGGAAELEVTRTSHGWMLGEAEGSLPIAWTGDQTELDAVLAQLGGPPSGRTERFAGFVDTFWPARGFPGPELPAWERWLGAVVGTALGSLAIELWGPVDDAPHRALDRLADLELEARPAAVAGVPSLTLAVPRGQRWLDLSRAGLVDRWRIPVTTSGWELVSW